MPEMRREVVAMLYWALRWHEGRRVSYAVLCELLWGEFAQKPKYPAASIRELMTYVKQRYGAKWRIEDSGRAFRIMPCVQDPRTNSKRRKAAPKRRAADPRTVSL